MAINLETGVEKNCDSLPFPMYKPAASNYGDDKIVVIGKQKAEFSRNIQTSPIWVSYNF